MTHFLSGKTLISMPHMEDPRFHKSIIMVCSHDENGAMGLVINNVMANVKIKELLGQIGIQANDNNALLNSKPVLAGGPVDTSRGFLVHSSKITHKDTIRIHDDIHVTGTVEALKSIAKSNEATNDLLLVLGYSGWSAGQLEKEIQDNAWLIVDIDPAIVFHSEPEEKWDLAIGKLGFDPMRISQVQGHA